MAAVAAASVPFALVLMIEIVEKVAVVVIVATATRAFETLFKGETITKCVKSCKCSKCDTVFVPIVRVGGC